MLEDGFLYSREDAINYGVGSPEFFKFYVRVEKEITFKECLFPQDWDKICIRLESWRKALSTKDPTKISSYSKHPTTGKIISYPIVLQENSYGSGYTDIDMGLITPGYETIFSPNEVDSGCISKGTIHFPNDDERKLFMQLMHSDLTEWCGVATDELLVRLFHKDPDKYVISEWIILQSYKENGFKDSSRF